jgi:hypothetical protein
MQPNTTYTYKNRGKVCSQGYRQRRLTFHALPHTAALMPRATFYSVPPPLLFPLPNPLSPYSLSPGCHLTLTSKEGELLTVEGRSSQTGEEKGIPPSAAKRPGHKCPQIGVNLRRHFYRSSYDLYLFIKYTVLRSIPNQINIRGLRNTGNVSS